MTAADVPRETLFVPEDFVQPTMPLELLQIGPNVRTEPGELEELASSIREFGVLQPVKVQSTPAGWTVLWGQRRVLAARLAGLAEIPVIVAPPAAADPVGLSFEQLVENLQRADLNAVDEAVALKAILDSDPKLTHDAVADKLGKSRPWVSNTIGLLEAPAVIQGYIRTGELTAAHAKALRGLPAQEAKSQAERAVKRGESAHELEGNAKYARQEIARRERDKDRLEKIGKAAITLLEKSVTKDALIVVPGGGHVAAMIKKAGWANQYAGDRWAVDVVKNAGECGCATWLVDYDQYSGKAEAKLKPACADETHRAARETARNEERNRERHESERQRAELEARREVDHAAIAAGIRPLLEDGLAPAIRASLLYCLVGGDFHRMMALNERHGGSKDSHDDRDDWPTISRLDSEGVLDELALAVASKLAPDGWYAERSAGARAAMLAALTPDPIPEPTGKPAKGKKPAGKAEPAGDVVVEQNPDDPPCDWPGCTRHAFHPGRHDPRLADGGADDDLLPD